uniref:Odorant receptor n=1 Tax=Sesamia inferens TaxID=492764 RepID=U5NJ19_SESIF|nr:putative odorant receptor [Sesamia inferens]
MHQPMEIPKPNEFTKLLDKVNTIGFLWGIKDIWVTDIKLSRRFVYIYNKFLYVLYINHVILSMSVLGSFFTQNDITDKQANDRLMFGILFPGHLILFYISLCYKQRNRNLLYQLAVVLKEHQNDADLEREMIKKIKVFSITLTVLIFMVFLLWGLRAVYRMVTAGENFITLILAWPDVHDESTTAGVTRVCFYFWWLPFATTIMATFLVMVIKLLAICYQYKNLSVYFYSLNDIFSNVTLSQAEKEMKYEQAFIVGIQMHSLTLWCKKQHEHISKGLFLIEIMGNCTLLLALIATLQVGERTLSQLITVIVMSISTCVSLGFFMWNGGDITVEASKLSNAMYSSGWQNCYGQSSIRIRKLVVNAMRQAQDPVVYKIFGVIDFSYESYVTLIKMPYTAVSVFY